MLARRNAAFALFACLALTAAGCSSNNTGKIVGKWKATTLPGMSAEQKATLEKLPPDAFSIVMEFTADGRMTLTVNLSLFGKEEKQEVASAKYALGTGDWVTFTELKPPQDGKTSSRDKVVINGDTMTINTDKGETITLTRMKDGGTEPKK